MHVTSEQYIAEDILEREFTLGEVPGILWTPKSASPAAPAPLILMGQPGGVGTRRMYARLVARARSAAGHGFASATIELPGAGDRPQLPGASHARADLARAISAGARPTDEVIDRLILPLVEQSVPEWQMTLDELLALPGIGERAGFSGGVIAIGTRLAAMDSRIAAAGLFAGSYVPRATFEDARRVTIPLHCCCNGTTKATIEEWPSTCSTLSARGRSPCTRTWAATQACPSSPATMPHASSSVISVPEPTERAADRRGIRTAEGRRRRDGHRAGAAMAVDLPSPRQRGRRFDSAAASAR